MYTSYFGLAEPPFAISPNPRYLYMSELHREALAHLLYGITSDGCMILLTGDVGTGKTTLCRCLLEQLPENTEVAVILNPRLTTRELLKTVCEEFGIFHESSTGSIKTYIDALNTHLLRAHANDRNIAIIVDEAQNLAPDVIEQLRLLTNLETPTRKLLRILLIGQPELRGMLERPEMAQVNQRITSRYHLSPLGPDDARNYIRHRLQIAGDTNSDLISSRAINHAVSLTGGIPRLINVLCDRALLGAYAVNSDQVNLEIMKRAGEEVFPAIGERRKRRQKIGTAIGVGLGLLLIPLLVFIPGWLPTMKPAPPPAEVKRQATPPPQEQAAPSIPPAQEVATSSQRRGLDEEHIEQKIAKAIPEDVSALNAPQLTATISPPDATEPAETNGEQAQPPEQMNKQPGESQPQKPFDIKENISLSSDNPSHESTEPAVAPTVPEDSEISTNQSTETTIRVSEPLLVGEKAGSEPEKAVRKLITR